MMVLHKPATVRRRQGLDSTGMTGSRRLYVKSFGCQMNVYDSQRMADTLAPEGYVETGSAEDADLIILNTCHIREKAAEKVYSELGRMRVLKEAGKAEGRDVRIAVAGCVAQAEGAEIVRRAPAVTARPRGARRQGRSHRVSARRQIRSSGRAERRGNAGARRGGFRHRPG